MNLPTLHVPLREDDSGVLRIADTRVRLDSVITAWQQGDSPEQIAENFDVLDLADVYAVISYYLHARSEVDNYLAHNRRQADELRRAHTDQAPPADLRERLLARRAALTTGDA